MLGLFKRDPRKRLRKSYEQKLEEAVAAQRAGRIERYAELTAEAEAIGVELDRLEAEQGRAT